MLGRRWYATDAPTALDEAVTSMLTAHRTVPETVPATERHWGRTRRARPTAEKATTEAATELGQEAVTNTLCLLREARKFVRAKLGEQEHSLAGQGTQH